MTLPDKMARINLTHQEHQIFPITFEILGHKSEMLVLLKTNWQLLERRRKLISRTVNASSELISLEQSVSQLPLITDPELPTFFCRFLVVLASENNLFDLSSKVILFLVPNLAIYLYNLAVMYQTTTFVYRLPV